MPVIQETLFISLCFVFCLKPLCITIYYFINVGCDLMRNVGPEVRPDEVWNILSYTTVDMICRWMVKLEREKHATFSMNDTLFVSCILSLASVCWSPCGLLADMFIQTIMYDPVESHFICVNMFACAETCILEYIFSVGVLSGDSSRRCKCAC